MLSLLLSAGTDLRCRAKYPLAIIAKAIQTFEPRWLCGFDVGCSFLQTVNHSSLADQFKECEGHLCVNAFHGYSHAHSCQLYHHPNVIPGMGIEDLETMERIFSISNQLAPIIRYTTAYRRRVLIDMHFQQWDHDRYLALGAFLRNNFVQALAIIDDQERSVADLLKEHDLTPEDLDRFLQEERTYVDGLGKEDPRNVWAVAYVEALEELRTIKCVA